MTQRNNSQEIMYIASHPELVDFVARAQGSDVLAIDTEFLREKTYYPKLCLLQLSTDEDTALVDPFTIGSLDPLIELFEDPSMVKLFHAGSQDIEIIHHELGVVPWPLFDTQMAAALLGHSAQVGYGPLVQSVCGVALKKGDSFTDWSRRPLADSQLAYAADDVIYLPGLYRKMTARLEELGRLDWLDAEFAELGNEDRYRVDPRERYLRLKRSGHLSRKQLSAAREVAAWREETAMQRNIPRKWVMTDEQVVEACRREARSVKALFMVRGLSGKMSTKDARCVCDAICRGMDLDEDAWPEGDKRNTSEHNVDAEVNALSAIVQIASKRHGIAFQTLASNSELTQVARGSRDVDVLKGWRAQIVGNDLVSFMEGRSTLVSVDGTVKVTNRE